MTHVGKMLDHVQICLTTFLLAENVQGEVLGVKAQGGSRIIDLVPLGNVL